MVRKHKNGFTLVELLAVIVILAILLVIAVPQIMKTIDNARNGAFVSSAKLIATSAEREFLTMETLSDTTFNKENVQINCEDVVELAENDYQDCKITFNNGKAIVQLSGIGKFKDKYICSGTKEEAIITNTPCNGSSGDSNLEDNTAPSVEVIDAMFAVQNFMISDFVTEDFPLTMKLYVSEDETSVYEEENLINTIEISKTGENVTYTQTSTDINKVQSIQLVNNQILVEVNYTHANEGVMMYIGASITDTNGNESLAPNPLPVSPAVGCFIAGTQIQTNSGLVNIENINVGDVVYSINIDTNEKVLDSVSWVQGTRYTNSTYTIFAGNEKIVTTHEHPFYVFNKGWVSADNLNIGDKLMDMYGNEVIINNVVYTLLDKPIQVYNFTVDNNHNYLLGKTGIVAHNIQK